MARRKEPAKDEAFKVRESNGKKRRPGRPPAAESNLPATIDAISDQELAEADGIRAKQRKALAMKLAGIPLTEIAKELGYADHTGAAGAIRACMKHMHMTELDDLKTIHNARLEHMFLLIWPDINKKDPSYMQLGLAILDRLERLHKLGVSDVPQGNTINAGVLVIGGEQESYTDSLRKARAALNGGQTPTIDVPSKEAG